MPVLSSKPKMYARPEIATNLLQIFIPTTFNSLFCQKRTNFTSAISLKMICLVNIWLLVQKSKIFFTEMFAYPKDFLGKYRSKRWAGLVQAESLISRNGYPLIMIIL